MNLIIEASNIRAGGGFVHLNELLNHLGDCRKYGFEQVIVIGGRKINELREADWLVKKECPQLDRHPLYVFLYKLSAYTNILNEYKGDLIFAPGGSFFHGKIAYVSMSQNMLVFEQAERRRFGVSLMRAKLKLLNILQLRSFKHALGVVYISEYARNYIQPLLGKAKKDIVISHGVSNQFKQKNKEIKPISSYTESSPFKLLYVSTISVYKHQGALIKALSTLRERYNYPVVLILAGTAYKPYLLKTKQHLSHEWVHYAGVLPHQEIHELYAEADAFVFPSTCENQPNALIEAIAAGLPILSSNYGPMPELANEAAVYVDPTDEQSLIDGLRIFLQNHQLRKKLSENSIKQAEKFSWDKTSHQTFSFLQEIAKNYKTLHIHE